MRRHKVTRLTDPRGVEEAGNTLDHSAHHQPILIRRTGPGGQLAGSDTR
jgi:hypothetical protein